MALRFTDRPPYRPDLLLRRSHTGLEWFVDVEQSGVTLPRYSLQTIPLGRLPAPVRSCGMRCPCPSRTCVCPRTDQTAPTVGALEVRSPRPLSRSPTSRSQRRP